MGHSYRECRAPPLNTNGAKQDMFLMHTLSQGKPLVWVKGNICMFHLTWGSQVSISFIPCHHHNVLVMLLMSKCFHRFDMQRWNRAIRDPAPIDALMRPRFLHMSISQVQPPMLAECSILAFRGVVAPHTDRFNCPNSTPSRMEAILGVLDLAYRPEQSEQRPRSGRRRGNNDFGWGSAAGLAETCPSPRVSEARECRRPTLRPRLNAAAPNS